MLTLSIVCLGVAIATQSAITAEELRRSAADQGDENGIVAAAREQPDTVREALARTFALATQTSTDEARAAEFAIARRLAAAYAAAWDDPFFVRQVASFEAWSPAQRRAKVEADSLRRAGIEALGREGLSAARVLWRAALDRTPRVDHAGRTAALSSVGAGFYLAGALDSATVYLTRSRDLALRIGDLRTRGNAVGILASVSKDLGDLARAAELYAEASAIRERSGDTRGIAADQNNLGLIARDLGDLREARGAFERSLALNRRAGRSRQVALNLTNLADIASITGEYARGEELYREALAINHAAGDRAETAFVLHHLALLVMRRGDYTQARVTLSEAVAIHDEAGAIAEAIAVRRDLAALQAAVGDVEAALGTLRRAEQDAAAAPGASVTLQASLVLARADLAVQLGQLAEAEAGYARAEQLYRTTGNDAGRAEAQQGRGLLLYLRDDYKGALRVLDLAASAQAGAGDRRAAALTQLLVGRVQRGQGDTAAARQTLTRAQASLHALGDVVGEAAAFVALGELTAQTGATLAAESFYRRGLERLGDRPAVDVRWQLYAGLAEALRSRGALGLAAQELRTAIAAIEEVAGGIRIEERRVGFLADKWKVYASLALVEQRRERPGEAFAVSELLRARQLRDMLARGRIPARRVASEREQDLRRRITELTQVIEVAGAHRRSLREPALAGTSVDVAREALAAGQRAYAELLLELRESDPAYAQLISGEPVSWQSVAARLTRDEVLLEYLVSDSTSTVFVVTTDTVAAVNLDVSRRALANLVEFVRRAMDRPGSSPASALWRTPLRRLHQYLIEPLQRAGLLDGKRTLVIVPHGELHFLPFAALLDAGSPGRFLVERYQLARAPSATVWVRVGERVQPPPNAGVLALAPRAGRLPASREEVLGIRGVYGPRATILVGGAASERALRAGIPHHSILHLATYGILNKHNPLFSFVELAPEADDDGRLEVHEVFGLDLASQLVVLSACQTALGSGGIADVPPGDDWVGLVQAFLYAGARAVLASLWPVEDRATARLMQRFYQQLAAGQSEAAALAEAQRALLRERRTSHPFYWAGLVWSGADLRE